MRALKVIGLGTVFSFVGFVIVLVISTKPIMVGSETSHATGVSAIIAGIVEALLEAAFNPLTWLVVVVAFGAAFLVVRKTSKRTSTS